MSDARKIAPVQGRLGVLTPGMGAVATTFYAGVIAARKGLTFAFAETLDDLIPIVFKSNPPTAKKKRKPAKAKKKTAKDKLARKKAPARKTPRKQTAKS